MEGSALVERLAQLTLFSDMRWPELEAIAHTFDEAVFASGQRVLRQGLTGGAFYVILEGEASVVIDDREVARLGRGDHFGEISTLLGEPPIADVRADPLLRCFVIPGQDVEEFLLGHPTVMLRLLQAEARRLRDISGGLE